MIPWPTLPPAPTNRRNREKRFRCRRLQTIISLEAAYKCRQACLDKKIGRYKRRKEQEENRNSGSLAAPPTDINNQGAQMEKSQILQVKLPVAPQIERAGDEGQCDGDPNGKWFKPGDPRPPKEVESENSRARRAPFRVTFQDQNGDDGDDLGNGLVFAIAFRGEDDIFGGRQQPQPGDGEFARNNDHNHPGRNPAKPDKGDERRADQYLVREGVHENAEVGNEVVAAGD